MPERINFVEIFELSEKIIQKKDTFIWLKLQNVNSFSFNVQGRLRMK